MERNNLLVCNERLVDGTLDGLPDGRLDERLALVRRQVEPDARLFQKAVRKVELLIARVELEAHL